ncbi:SRPBCC domain-containing protein [Paenibacillus sp. FSL W7-1279]|uniref:SRPBCC family protein n=1 Tax=Paenibacillus TaxID=44249 RepID=UPI00188B2798|nr:MULTISPECIES: SRPBCC domain-containing protein [Paenibacillus]MBU5345312.1 SRPBCC domain-containing protein [Paenibacillus lautus]MBX4146184.1 SRPBCC domain-containing protein [Paenibacillus lautus]
MDNASNGKLPDIRHTLVLKAPIEKVWKAVATAEGISAWFMPNNFEPVEGFEFQLNAGPFGNSPCKVTLIDEPNRLSFNWGKDWSVTFELVQQGDHTEFTLIHGGWTADQVTEFGEAHDIVRGRMDNGWAGIVQKLAGYVEA